MKSSVLPLVTFLSIVNYLKFGITRSANNRRLFSFSSQDNGPTRKWRMIPPIPNYSSLAMRSETVSGEP